MNKFDRVISTYVLLQSRKLIQAKTLSDHFNVSLRTVYRDIATLKNAGIPIIGDPGIGYSLMDGYKLPPVRFDEGEATALLTAEKFIGKFTDKETQELYNSAMTKIRATLRSNDKEAIDILDNSISISDRSIATNDSYLQVLFKAISSRQVLKMAYTKADGTQSERQIESIGCYHHRNDWYLVAYCQLKKDYRTFKLNRINNLEPSSDYFNTKHISFQDYINKQDESWKREHQFQTIKIHFTHTYAHFAESRKYYFGYVDQTASDEGVLMTFSIGSMEFMCRWLIQFGKEATVLEPKELKDRLKELAMEIYGHYKE